MTDKIEFQIGDWAIGNGFQGEVIHIEKFSLIRDLICVEIVWPTRLNGRTYDVYSTNLKKANPKIEDGDLVEFGGKDFYIRGWACINLDGVIDICADKTLQEIVFSSFDGVRLLRKAEKGE